MSERPAWMDDPSWVLRIAMQRRVCTSCDDWIHVGERYFLVLNTQEIWCCACPPEGVEECCL